jgi:hypothetical protein
MAKPQRRTNQLLVEWLVVDSEIIELKEEFNRQA